MRYNDGMLRGIDRLLAAARARLDRMGPIEASAAVARGDALLVDIRDEDQRTRDGLVPGALLIARNVLEWRCDPESVWRNPRVADPARRIVLMCDQGCQSSLAAATLQELGLLLATDLDGGFQAWRAAGLPVVPVRPSLTPPTPPRENGVRTTVRIANEG
jgi:rhodanese-related sulfurtransferase